MLTYNNLREKQEDLISGKLSCEDNVKNFLKIIEKDNSKLNIFLEINSSAIDIAINLDIKRKNGEKLGPLFGFCFAIKCVISVKDMIISCASNTLSNYKATYDADIVKKILDADGIIIGIVNADEFACGASGEHSAFGKTINPFAQNRIPGGSSSGSAAAVSANFCDIAIGTDTGGSIRNPASHCNVVGIKPSYGRVSRFGLIDMSMSLDTIGPIAKDVYGAALTLEIMAGHSNKDATTFEDIPKKYSSLKSKEKYKIGVIKEFKDLIIDKEIKEVFENKLKELKNLGHEIIELSLSHIELAVQTYYPIVYTEIFSASRKFDGLKYAYKIEDTCGEEVLRRILGGKEISRSEFDGAYYKKALKVKSIIAKEFEKAFSKVDFLLSPITPKLPHRFEDKLSPEDEYAYDAFTTPINLAGICAASIPAGFSKEKDELIPIGIQIIAANLREDILIPAMYLLESLKETNK